MSTEISIRKVKSSDINNLISFFKEAYGEKTVFQNKEFLTYYFKSQFKNIDPLSYNLIAVNSKGKIVSHYGGLNYKIQLKNIVLPIVWGVNAFTLNKWRGKGINSKIVNYIQKNNEINAVIGMPFEAPFFYKKFGYNIFNKTTLDRFVYILNNNTFTIIEHLNQNLQKAKKLLKIKELNVDFLNISNIIELTKDNFKDFEYNLKIHSISTTYRDISFLSWRIFNNPYIIYKVFGYKKNNTIISYIAIREENLQPSNFKVSRIIDLFGQKEGICYLLKQTLKYSIERKSIYIDFSKYGELYSKELLSFGFIKLENENVCLLPQVTSPIENRPNHEFIVLQSKKYNNEIQTLTSKNAYFTRIDGDRDRISNINQIETKNAK